MMLNTRTIILTALLVMVLAACGAPGGEQQGVVLLTRPQDSTVVYASALFISGTASGIGDDGLRVRLTGEDGSLLAETTLMKPATEWQAEIIHGYTGEPRFFTVDVLPVNAGMEQTPTATQAVIYDSATVIISALEHRPEGVFGDVIFPQDGDEVGGDQFQVQGRISGIEEGTFEMTLVSSDGTTIDQQTVTLASPYAVDDQPWTGDLSLNGYTGSAVLNVIFTEDLTVSIPVVLRAAAG